MCCDVIVSYVTNRADEIGRGEEEQMIKSLVVVTTKHRKREMHRSV